MIGLIMFLFNYLMNCLISPSINSRMIWISSLFVCLSATFRVRAEAVLAMRSRDCASSSWTLDSLYIYIYIYIYTHVCMYVCMHVCMYVCIYIYIYIYIHTYICTYHHIVIHYCITLYCLTLHYAIS